LTDKEVRREINWRDVAGNTALRWACMRDDTMVVKMLLSHWASMDIGDKINMLTPKDICRYMGLHECMKQLKVRKPVNERGRAMRESKGW